MLDVTHLFKGTQLTLVLSSLHAKEGESVKCQHYNIAVLVNGL